MQIGTDTKFPEHITVPETLKVPDGNVIKFVLYAIAVVEYKFNASDSTWHPFGSQAFFYNDPKDVSYDTSSIVAAGSTSPDESGKLVGVIKSVLPGDSSSITGRPSVIEFDAKTKTLHGSLGQNESCEGPAFADVTYIQTFPNGPKVDAPGGSHPDGYICRIPSRSAMIFYKSA